MRSDRAGCLIERLETEVEQQKLRSRVQRSPNRCPPSLPDDTDEQLRPPHLISHFCCAVQFARSLLLLSCLVFLALPSERRVRGRC